MHISRPSPKRKKKIYTAGLQAAFEKEKQVFSDAPYTTMIESSKHFCWAQLHSTHASRSLYIWHPLAIIRLNQIIDTNAHCVHVGQQSWSAGCARCIHKHTIESYYISSAKQNKTAIELYNTAVVSTTKSLRICCLLNCIKIKRNWNLYSRYGMQFALILVTTHFSDSHCISTIP